MTKRSKARPALLLLTGWIWLTGCQKPAEPATGTHSDSAEAEHVHAGSASDLMLPMLEPLELAADERLQVVASTSVIGDVLLQVGGDSIDLQVLMKAGQDPHGYEPSARDLTAVADADVIFINGWDLEAGLVDDLLNIAADRPVVPISAGVEPRAIGSGVDPHVWLDPHNVLIWIDNAERILGSLDQQRSDTYRQNAAEYRGQIDQLIDEVGKELAAIPADRRRMVTNHDSLGYFAARYDLEIVGTIIPGADTLAEPSASGMSRLVETMRDAGICTVYAETSARDQLARAVAAELTSCAEVQVLPLFTGAISDADGRGGSYISMMRANVAAIVEGQTHE